MKPAAPPASFGARPPISPSRPNNCQARSTSSWPACARPKGGHDSKRLTTRRWMRLWSGQIACRAIERLVVGRIVVGRQFDRIVLLAGVELHDFPGNPGKYCRNRIDAKHRLVGRTEGFLGHREQPLITAAADDQPEDRNLAEHIIQPVHRNE